MGASEKALTSVVSVAIVVLISSVSLISIRQCVLVLFLFVIAKLPQLSSWIFLIFFRRSFTFRPYYRVYSFIIINF